MRGYAGSGVYDATVLVPQDGDATNEANCGKAWEGNANRTSALNKAFPKIYSAAFDDVGALAYFTYVGGSGLQTTAALSNGKVDVPGCGVGDRIQVFCTFNWAIMNGGTNTGFDAYVDAIDNVTGTPSAQAHVPGAHFDAQNGIPASSSLFVFTATIGGMWTVTAAGTTRLTFAFQGAWVSNLEYFKIVSSFGLSAILWKV